MVTFEYRGYDQSGRARRGLVEASDRKQARAQLLRSGILVEQIMSAGAGRRRRMNAAARAMIYQELSMLLRSGQTLVDAMELLLGMPDLARWHGAIAEARDRVRGGEALAPSVAAWGASIGECAAITAGEKAAILPVVLERLAGFMDEQRALRERALTAMLYPAMVAGLALLIAVGLFGVGLPRFGRLMAEARIELPAFTRVMLAGGNILFYTFAALVLVAILAGIWMRRRLAEDEDFAVRLDRRLLCWPLLGPHYACLAALRFARTLEFLLAGGVALVDALPMAGDSTGNRWLALRIRQAAEEVRQGGALSATLGAIHPFGELFGGWIRVGESGGLLENVLRNVGDRLQRRWERNAARRLALLEPALIVLVGLLVLLVALAVLLPIMRMNQLLT